MPSAKKAPRGGRIQWSQWALWLVTLLAVTGALYLLRGHLEKAHVALVYLLVVLGGSAAGGRWIGVTLSGLAFLCFNYFFLPPYYTLIIEQPLDWLVLVAFLVTGVVAAQLLSQAQERAEIARQRTAEVERLASLGAETLNVGRAEEALVAVATVIRSALAVSCCEILVPPGLADSARGLSGGVPTAVPSTAPLEIAASVGSGLLVSGSGGRASDDFPRWVLEHRAPAVERADGTRWIGSPAAPTALPGDADTAFQGDAQTDLRVLLVPLIVRDRTVGVLRLAHDAPLRLDPDARQFLVALSYYAALGVERVRLTATAERAEAFRQADELKTALIATVSHDLRTPLTTIKALAHRLASRGEEDALSIEEEADRLNRFVADLLDLSRLSAGALQLRVELNAVDDLVGAALDRVRGATAGRDIRVIRTDGREAEEPILFARFDLVQSLRVLVNLLENAAKYAPAAPIELWIGREGARILLTVADRGAGVPAGDEALIFEPFYRAPGASPDVGGAGLGLPIARGIAEAQGGSLTYAPRPGGGSEFCFALPAATENDLAHVHDLLVPDDS